MTSPIATSWLRFSLLSVLLFTAASSATSSTTQTLQCGKARYPGSRSTSIHEMCVKQVGCSCIDTPSGPSTVCVGPKVYAEGIDGDMLAENVNYCHDHCSCAAQASADSPEELYADNYIDTASQTAPDYYTKGSLETASQVPLGQSKPQSSENPAAKLEIRARPRFAMCHHVVCNDQYHCDGLTMYKSCGPMRCLLWDKNLPGDPDAINRPRKIVGLSYCEPVY